MTRSLFPFLIILLPLAIIAQSRENNKVLSPEAKYVFKNVKSGLSIAEKNFFAKGYKLYYDDPKYPTLKFFDKDDSTLNDVRVDVEVYPVDLNKDGIEEIFVRTQSDFFGPQIQDLSLYIKDINGDYIQQENVNSPEFSVRATSSGGFPDLIGGPGGGPGFNKPPTRFDVFRWDGKKYKLFKKNQPHIKTDKVAV